MKKAKKLAVIYCRTATTEKTDKAKLEEQEKQCRVSIKRNGYKLHSIIKDFGYGGMSSERPGLVHLNNIIDEGKISAIYVTEPNRLYRHMEKLLELDKKLRKAKITICIALRSGDVLPMTEDAQKIASDMFSNFYPYLISERTKQALARRKQKLQESNQK